MIGRRAAVAAQQLATVSALHAEAYVAVGVCAVDQHAQLLQRQVVLCQVRELRWTPHLCSNKHTGKQEGRQASKHSRTLAMWRVEALPSAVPACAHKGGRRLDNRRPRGSAVTQTLHQRCTLFMLSTTQVGCRTGTSPRGPGCTHLAACMLLEHAVGDLLVALAAHTEALDVAVSCDAAPQQLQRAATSHAAVLHLLPCAPCTMHGKQHRSGKQSGWAARVPLACRRSFCTARVLGDFTDTSPHCMGLIQSHLPDGSKTTHPVHTSPVPAQPCLKTATQANHALSITPQAANRHTPPPAPTHLSAPHI